MFYARPSPLPFTMIGLKPHDHISNPSFEAELIKPCWCSFVLIFSCQGEGCEICIYTYVVACSPTKSNSAGLKVRMAYIGQKLIGLIVSPTDTAPW